MSDRVAVRADAVPEVGSGHVVRVLGLADELRSRGVEVLLVGAVEIPWVRDLVAARAIPVSPAPKDAGSFLAWCLEHGVGVAVLDDYGLPPDLGATLRAGGLRVLSLRDGTFGAEQACDVALDQNLGAERAPLPWEGVLLAGASFTLFRDEVLHATHSPWATERDGSRVLMFFGGSDPFRAADVLGPIVIDAVDPLDLRVVTADPDVADRLRAMPRGRRQSVTVLAPRPDVLSLARGADFVVTATGSTVWELMVQGVAFACVQVADNQAPGYRVLVDRGLCVGLGSLDTLRDDPGAARQARTALAELAGSADLRAGLTARGRGLFDGLGRARVADELLPSTGQPRPPAPHPSDTAPPTKDPS